MLFTIHVVSWLPYTKLDNLFWHLPNRERLGPAAAGPYWEGDQQVIPPWRPDDFRHRTCRAYQILELPLTDWGDAPTARGGNVGANPLHVLAEDGARLHSFPAAVTRSAAHVGYNAVEEGYDVSLEGAATIPYLLEAEQAWAAFQETGVAPEAAAGTETTPAISWNVQLRLRRGTADAPPVVATGFDESGGYFGANTSLGGEENVVDGTIDYGGFPSYVVYVSLRRGRGERTAPAVFVSGVGHNLARVRTRPRCRLRRLTW